MATIVHNLEAMNSMRQLGITGKRMTSVTEKLSSGYRINRSADDAAGLSISEKMRRQIRGLSQGIDNSKDGVSLCQVADGALDEVTNMLHRITELSVKAANGTNTYTERKYIQSEIQQILSEIDRIGDTTKFNERPIFKGEDEVMRNADGSSVIQGDIPFDDFTIADVNLGNNPFGASSSADHLALQAIVKNTDSGAYGKTYNLIYGNGSTSKSSFRVSYDKGDGIVTKTVNLRELSSTQYQYDSVNQAWSRSFHYQNEDGIDVTVTQKVHADTSGGAEKNYKISYEVSNATVGMDVGLDFMFHADTAYNNDDFCEGYFIDGTRVDKFSVYTQPTSPFTQGNTSANIIDGMPSSLSIVDTDRALAFTEKISFGSSQPDSLSIGFYASIDDWPYYNSLDTNTQLGDNAIRKDLGFSLLWNDQLGAAGSGNEVVTYDFSYGIVATETDTNLKDVDIKKDDTETVEHHGTWNIWIQSGNEKDDGIMLSIDEMNVEVLGLRDLDVSTVEGAGEALTQVNGALHKILTNRSKIGAQQNRLDHTIANEENIVENTTAAESRIRDTDMSKEMMTYTNIQIILQAGQAMLAQANKSKQTVLQLIQ